MITPGGPIGFCRGDSAELSASTFSGVNYQWNLEATPVPGANDPVFVAAVSGNYTVSVNNSGCIGVSPAVVVKATSEPDKPVITKTSNGLSSSAVAGNQWYRQGVVLAGDTSQLYVPKDPATAYYSVAVTIAGCTGPLSDTVYYSQSTAIGGNPGGTGPTGDTTYPVHLGPNPVTNQLRISYQVAGVSAVNVRMVNINGRVGREWENVGTGRLLNVAGMPNGLYMVKINSANGQVNMVIKILKE